MRNLPVELRSELQDRNSKKLDEFLESFESAWDKDNRVAFDDTVLVFNSSVQPFAMSAQFRRAVAKSVYEKAVTLHLGSRNLRSVLPQLASLFSTVLTPNWRNKAKIDVEFDWRPMLDAITFFINARRRGGQARPNGVSSDPALKALTKIATIARTFFTDESIKELYDTLFADNGQADEEDVLALPPIEHNTADAKFRPQLFCLLAHGRTVRYEGGYFGSAQWTPVLLRLSVWSRIDVSLLVEVMQLMIRAAKFQLSNECSAPASAHADWTTIAVTTVAKSLDTTPAAPGKGNWLSSSHLGETVGAFFAWTLGYNNTVVPSLAVHTAAKQARAMDRKDRSLAQLENTSVYPLDLLDKTSEEDSAFDAICDSSFAVPDHLVDKVGVTFCNLIGSLRNSFYPGRTPRGLSTTLGMLISSFATEYATRITMEYHGKLPVRLLPWMDTKVHRRVVSTVAELAATSLYQNSPEFASKSAETLRALGMTHPALVIGPGRPLDVARFLDDLQSDTSPARGLSALSALTLCASPVFDSRHSAHGVPLLADIMLTAIETAEKHLSGVRVGGTYGVLTELFSSVPLCQAHVNNSVGDEEDVGQETVPTYAAICKRYVRTSDEADSTADRPVPFHSRFWIPHTEQVAAFDVARRESMRFGDVVEAFMQCTFKVIQSCEGGGVRSTDKLAAAPGPGFGFSLSALSETLDALFQSMSDELCDLVTERMMKFVTDNTMLPVRQAFATMLWYIAQFRPAMALTRVVQPLLERAKSEDEAELFWCFSLAEHSFSQVAHLMRDEHFDLAMSAVERCLQSRYDDVRRTGRTAVSSLLRGLSGYHGSATFAACAEERALCTNGTWRHWRRWFRLSTPIAPGTGVGYRAEPKADNDEEKDERMDSYELRVTRDLSLAWTSPPPDAKQRAAAIWSRVMAMPLKGGTSSLSQVLLQGSRDNDEDAYTLLHALLRSRELLGNFGAPVQAEEMGDDLERSTRALTSGVAVTTTLPSLTTVQQARALRRSDLDLNASEGEDSSLRIFLAHALLARAHEYLDGTMEGSSRACVELTRCLHALLFTGHHAFRKPGKAPSNANSILLKAASLPREIQFVTLPLTADSTTRRVSQQVERFSNDGAQLALTSHLFSLCNESVSWPSCVSVASGLLDKYAVMKNALEVMCAKMVDFAKELATVATTHSMWKVRLLSLARLNKLQRASFTLPGESVQALCQLLIEPHLASAKASIRLLANLLGSQHGLHETPVLALEHMRKVMTPTDIAATCVTDAVLRPDGAFARFAPLRALPVSVLQDCVSFLTQNAESVRDTLRRDHDFLNTAQKREKGRASKAPEDMADSIYVPIRFLPRSQHRTMMRLAQPRHLALLQGALLAEVRVLFDTYGKEWHQHIGSFAEKLIALVEEDIASYKDLRKEDHVTTLEMFFSLARVALTTQHTALTARLFHSSEGETSVFEQVLQYTDNETCEETAAMLRFLQVGLSTAYARPVWHPVRVNNWIQVYQARAATKPRNKKKAAQRHSGFIGLIALVLSRPSDLPTWLPAVATHLADLSFDDATHKESAHDAQQAVRFRVEPAGRCVRSTVGMLAGVELQAATPRSLGGAISRLLHSRAA
ncbi:MAG: hypothetical protein MHM6MM_002781 [Cercozoa sp. M6MM]